MDPDPDPNPAIFAIDLQDANKKQFLKVHLQNFSKIKSKKQSQSKALKH
jgi:hypothetical protein